MKYFNENMNVNDARRHMFDLTEQMRDNEKNIVEMRAEYAKVKPILRQHEKQDPNWFNMLTS